VDEEALSITVPPKLDWDKNSERVAMACSISCDSDTLSCGSDTLVATISLQSISPVNSSSSEESFPTFKPDFDAAADRLGIGIAAATAVFGVVFGLAADRLGIGIAAATAVFGVVFGLAADRLRIGIAAATAVFGVGLGLAADGHGHGRGHGHRRGYIETR